MNDNSPTISVIAAISNSGVIGADGHLPWRIPSDLHRFRKITMGKPVVFGRKTYETIGRPLDGRINIVLSRNPEFPAPGCIICSSLEEVLNLTEGFGEIVVAGGEDVYRDFLPLSSRLYITKVLCDVAGDKFFPIICSEGWELRMEREIETGDDDEFSTVFRIYEH